MPPKKRTYDDKSVCFNMWTTRKLKRELRKINAYIDDGCFGVSDLMLQFAYGEELYSRKK